MNMNHSKPWNYFKKIKQIDHSKGKENVNRFINLKKNRNFQIWSKKLKKITEVLPIF